AVGGDACGATCIVSNVDKQLTMGDVKRTLARGWPAKGSDESTVSVAGHPYLLVAEPLIEGRAARGMVVAGVDANYLVVQATRTAWLLLAIAYGLLVL